MNPFLRRPPIILCFRAQAFARVPRHNTQVIFTQKSALNMGRKRTHELTEDEIRRKIKKLENKLAKTRPQSSDEDFNDIIEDAPQTAPRSESHVVMIHHDASPRDDSPRAATPRGESPLPPPSPPPLPPSPPPLPPTVALPAETTVEPVDKDAACAEEFELDDEILQLLGDAPKTDQQLGPPIHKDIACRWQEILSKGLTREDKEKLMKQYMVPRNCDLLVAPTLNPEAKAALPEALVKRDSIIMQKQNHLGLALSALATVTELIISGETSKQKILKPLSDACRILCDNHQVDTKTRRNFVISAINTDLKDTLIESGRDKFLFGENVSEKVKIAKSIQRSGEALKNQQKPLFNKKNFFPNKGNLNFKPTHRKTDNKTAGANAARAGRLPPPRAPRPAPSSSARHAPAPRRSSPTRYTRRR